MNPWKRVVDMKQPKGVMLGPTLWDIPSGTRIQDAGTTPLGNVDTMKPEIHPRPPRCFELATSKGER